MAPLGRARAAFPCVVTGLVLAGMASSCGRGGGARASGGKELLRGSPMSSASAAASATSRPGMAYVPAGVLLAGTPVNRAPRVAEEELPGTKMEMGEFFIDLLPYPNEAGAIATTNVSRDEATALCAARNKRLCTELEWERACKGPANTTYEDGDDFHPATCGLGAAAELSAKRPTGELSACTSGFGVHEMHGGAWEWTELPWGRGGRKDLGVLKGGNAVAGEIAGRCANSLARPPATKSAAMGFRCCAGAKNEAKVSSSTKVLPALERSMQTADIDGPMAPVRPRDLAPEKPERARRGTVRVRPRVRLAPRPERDARRRLRMRARRSATPLRAPGRADAGGDRGRRQRRRGGVDSRAHARRYGLRGSGGGRGRGRQAPQTERPRRDERLPPRFHLLVRANRARRYPSIARQLQLCWQTPS